MKINFRRFLFSLVVDGWLIFFFVRRFLLKFAEVVQNGTWIDRKIDNKKCWVKIRLREVAKEDLRLIKKIKRWLFYLSIILRQSIWNNTCDDEKDLQAINQKSCWISIKHVNILKRNIEIWCANYYLFLQNELLFTIKKLKNLKKLKDFNY